MSLRGFFSRNNLSYSRRKKALASPALAAGAESLEDRVLLSVESPLLNDHGVTFENEHVLDENIAFFAVNNPLFSNNNAANPDPNKGPGSGLSVTLDGSQLFGNPPNSPVIPQVNSLTLSPSQGPLAFNNNANVGASISLSNLSMDSLVIDGSQFDSNGRAGLIINLNNVQIGSITIVNSTFTNNANDGFCIVGNQSQVGSLVMTGNTFSGNSTSGLNNAAMIQFQDSLLGDVLIQGNQLNSTNGGGFHLDLDNTDIPSLEFLDNGLDGNDSGVFFDFQDSNVEGTVQNNTVVNSTQGDGLRIEMRRSILPDGSTTPGLRNLDLEQIRGNTLSGNAGAGMNIDLGQNTRFRSVITANEISNNGRSGLNLQARDTQNAFDVQIGSNTPNGDTNNVDANTIDANSGAGIAVTLDDTSAVVGNTTGRFQIMGNTITNTTDDNDLNTEFAGEGIFVRARGSVALVNGAARLLNSQVDDNTVSGNASHGIAFDISEDSEVFDLLIGDEFNPADPTEGVEGDGFNFQGQFFRNSGNTVENNGGGGLSFLRRDAATTRNVRIIDNLFDGNANGIDYTVRNDDNIINSVTIQHNDATNNLLNGMQISTQIDASLIATMDNNFVSGNQGDGILTLGFEGDPTDAETLGGVWTRNTIQENEGRGININGIPGTVNPLVIGLQGTDSRGNSLGNLVDSNGNDGVEINAPGVIELVNNIITANGQNNTAQDVHGDGKGIDINLNDNDAGFNTTGALNAFLGFNVIQGNFGDGLEIISRGNGNFSTVVEVLAHGNIIDLNLGRGVDVLNSGTSDTYLAFGDGSMGTGSNRNIIRSNGLEGFYTVNTPSVNQRQDVDADDTMVADANMSGLQRTWTPDLTLDIDGNQIQQNGLPGNFGQLNGSGLVVRVGTSGSLGLSEGAAAEIADRDGYGFNVQTVGVGASNSAKFGNGRVNARVNGNMFGGNLGVDVITESFEATVDPPDTAGTWDADDYDITGNSYRTDPLARLNLEFTDNTGESIDLVRLGAFYNNGEGDFKSRTNKDDDNPDGPFGNSAGRFRNAQRLPDRTNSFGSPFVGTGGLNTAFGDGVSGSISSFTPGGPMTPIVVTTESRTGSISDATNADPIVITSFNHGLATGEFVEITGVAGNTAANGIFEVNVLDQDTFELLDPFTGETVPGNGDYAGGGSWTVVRQGTIDDMSGDGVSPIQITSFGQFGSGHGLSTGDQVTVAGVEGNTAANGTFTVTVINSFTFTLDGTTGNGDWVPGTGAFFVSSGSHGLEDNDVVFLDVFPFNISPPGFEISGVYEVSVISPTQFQLNGTEGETDVPFDFFGEFRQVTNDFALMYPGVGSSTFRIIESGNDFPSGNDFSEDTIEQEIFYANSGTGHLSYTFDRETPDTFNFRQISVGDVTVAEGEQAEFTFNLSEAMTTDLVINYRTEFAGSASDGTSIPVPGDPADYTFTTDSVTIPAGETQATVAIDTISDDIFEDDEIFKLVIDSAFTQLPDSTSGFTFIEEFATPIDPFAVATIVDDDSQPTISISDTGGFEQGDGSVGSMTFEVTLSNPSSSSIFVDFSTADFTADAGSDYRRNQGTLTFAPGETSKTLTVDILPDSPTTPGGPDADQETLFLNLSAPVEATIADSQGLGTIFEPRFVSISDAFVNGDGESPNTASAQFTVTLTDANGNPLSVPSGQTITVNFNTADGSATVADGDYDVPTVNSLEFTQFTNQMPLFVTANQDRIFEGDETFSVTISSEQGTIQRGTGTGNILEQYEVASTRDAGGQGVIRMFDSRTNAERFSINPYPGFQGEVRLATGDFNGDGIADLVTSPGPGGGPHIKVLSGADGSLISQFMAYNGGFTGGVFVAAGDINGDGQLDILTGPDAGGGPHVKVFDGDGSSGNLIENFMAVGQPAGAGFAGGIRVASGDVDGDGVDDIVLGYGPGDLPLVEAYSSDAIPATVPTLFRTFNAYVPAFGGGVYVSTADIGGGPMNEPDGMADIITGPGAGGGPHVKVFNGDKLDELESFFAYTSGFTGGVRVASGDLANSPTDPARDRVSEILTSPGPGGGPHVRGFSVDGDINTPPQPAANLFAFSANLTSGVFISGRSRDLAGEGSPLMLEAGAAPATEEAVSLTAEMLDPVVEAALDRLSRAGIGEAALSQLRQLAFVITDLEGAVLGRQLPGRILIDRTAAGRGYFVDLTPDRDEEFSLIDGELRAVDASAQGRVDLLTVVLHEMGHALGEEHAEDGDHLLAPTLSPGERRLPEYDAVFAEHDLFESLLHLS